MWPAARHPELGIRDICTGRRWSEESPGGTQKQGGIATVGSDGDGGRDGVGLDAVVQKRETETETEREDKAAAERESLSALQRMSCAPRLRLKFDLCIAAFDVCT